MFEGLGNATGKAKVVVAGIGIDDVGCATQVDPHARPVL